MPNLKDEPSLQQLYSSVHNQLYASQKDLYTWLQVLEELARSPQFGMLYHWMQRQLATVQVRLQQAALELRKAEGQLQEENAETLAQRRRQKELELWEQNLYARQQQLEVCRLIWTSAPGGRTPSSFGASWKRWSSGCRRARHGWSSCSSRNRR